PTLVESAAAASVTGANNWLQTNAIAGTLTASVQSAAPGFRAPAANDYTLAPGSVCIGAANPSLYGLPGREYFRNEITNRMWRIRAAARDIGAFEAASMATAIGPYDSEPRPQLAAIRSGASVIVSWPLFAADFQLEKSSSLFPAAWSAAAFVPATNASDIRITALMTGGSVFFRLKK